MSVSYYDLLGVEPHASVEAIRAAWRSCVADLDPTDRRFRALSQAAEVLLDPHQRAEYDERLHAEHEAEEASRSASPADAPGEAGPRPDGVPAERTGWVPPAWLLALVGLVALALVGAATWLGLQPSEAEVEQATRQAQAAAEEAVGPILDYDATDMDASQDRAHAHLTSSYRKEYDKFFSGVVATNAPALGTKVTTDVLASGITRSGQDRAEIVLFINQLATSKKNADGDLFHNQVTVTMQRVDGSWLVDAMDTSPLR